MKKGLKYFAGVLLIIGALANVNNERVLSALAIGLLGLIILPPISNSIKDMFSKWNNKWIRYSSYFLLFIVFMSSDSKEESPSVISPKPIVINYIKNNPQDAHMKNIAYLVEMGELFGTYNASLKYPEQSNRVYEQKDAGEDFRRFMFRPDIDFKKAKEYLNPDKEYGFIKDYQVVFEVDSNGNIFNMKSAIKYDDTPFVGYSKNDVPDLRDYINTEIVDARLAEKQQQDKAYEEKKQMNKVMGNADFWNLYDPMVKTRIYKFIVDKNCKKLQIEFNTADDMRKRKHKSSMSASKEVDLMDFLNNKMSDIGCY
ncbi:MAG: hypothetical protein N4A45_06865 [Flavobacteriales bacterium]|jgi:hypothetical protein|nr:hypothetical protein [Flavobacteriales bacterium]